MIQRTYAQDGAMSMTLSNGTTFSLTPLPEADRDSSPAIIFNVAADVVDDLASATQRITNDNTLSSIGKAQKLEPLRHNTVVALAVAWANLGPFERDLDKREADLLAVPVVHSTHTAVAIEDREIRDWWRALPDKKRLPLLGEISEGAGGLERIELALLRSPVALADHELKVLRESWNRQRRAENMGEVLAIDAGRGAIAWARRGFAHLIGITNTLTQWSAEKTLRALASPENEDRVRTGYLAWGFNERQFAEMRRRVAAEAKRAA